MASLVGYAAVGEAALELTEDATTDEAMCLQLLTTPMILKHFPDKGRLGLWNRH